MQKASRKQKSAAEIILFELGIRILMEKDSVRTVTAPESYKPLLRSATAIT
jgi:hypothetical protein